MCFTATALTTWNNLTFNRPINIDCIVTIAPIPNLCGVCYGVRMCLHGITPTVRRLGNWKLPVTVFETEFDVCMMYNM